MAMTFKCPACGRELEAPAAAAGQHGVCKFCGARIIAPAAPGQPGRLEVPPAVPPPAETAAAPPGAAAPPDAAAPPGAAAWRAAPGPRPVDPAAWRAAPGASAPADLPPPADFMQRAFGFGVDFVGQWVVFLLLSPVLAALNPWPAGDLGSALSGLASGSANPRDMAGSLDLLSLVLSQVYWLFWFGLVQWLYFALFESSRLQATPGKLLAGTKVTDMEGRRIGFGRATTRAFAKGLSAALCYIGYLMAAFNDRRQTLHDMIAQTLVLKR